MATVKSFEDLEVWKKARVLCKQVHLVSSTGEFAEDFSLRNQINSSSGSVMDNIAEGFDRNGNREFIQFLSIAKGSCAETRSQLYRALDKGYLSESSFESLKNECAEISGKLSNLMKYLKSTDMKGYKFSEPDEAYEKYRENFNTAQGDEFDNLEL